MLIKTKYIFTSRDKNTGRICNTKIDSSSFERVEECRYLGTTQMNQNFIQKEMKSRFKSGKLAIIWCS